LSPELEQCRNLLCVRIPAATARIRAWTTVTRIADIRSVKPLDELAGFVGKDTAVLRTCFWKFGFLRPLVRSPIISVSM
jgi:hypothetical protein